MTVWDAWCDGSAIPNPGRMGLGAVLVAPDGSRHAMSRSPAGDGGCNNEAELRAVTMALEEAKTRGATVVRVHCDNSIVVTQLAGASGKTGSSTQPIVRLADLFDAARSVVAGFERVELVWIPRIRNAEADRLARAALGAAPKQRKAKHLRR